MLFRRGSQVESKRRTYPKPLKQRQEMDINCMKWQNQDDDLGILAELLPQHEPQRYKGLLNPISIDLRSKALRVFEHLLVVLQPIHLIQLGFVIESPPGREKPRFEADEFAAGFKMSLHKCRNLNVSRRFLLAFLKLRWRGSVSTTRVLRQPIPSNARAIRSLPWTIQLHKPFIEFENNS